MTSVDMPLSQRNLPKLIPRMSWLRTIMVKMAMGMTSMAAAALISPQFTPTADWNFDSATGPVVALRVVSTNASRNSFIDWIRQNTAVVAIPGTTIGSDTFRNTCHGP